MKILNGIIDAIITLIIIAMFTSCNNTIEEILEEVPDWINPVKIPIEVEYNSSDDIIIQEWETIIIG